MRATTTCRAVLIAAALLLAVASGPSRAQGPEIAAGPTDPGGQAPRWSFDASVYGYVIPDGRNYLQPSFTADRDWLHLEARYNYESLDTGSAWAGYAFCGGTAVEWEVTPMVGAVFGSTTGLAPGYRGAVGWRFLEFASEGEYVIDARDAEASFFYNWSELAILPTSWLRTGIVTQRTRAYASPRDIQRGLFAGVAVGRIDMTVYVFNPDDSRPIVVAAAVVGF